MRRLLPLLLIACAAPEPGSVKIIGHGGMGAGSPTPMNSEASVREALELGLDGVEMDVQLTADGVLVAYHAQDLDDLSSCKGKVNAMNWSAIRHCTVGGYDNTRYPIVRVDSLLLEAATLRPFADFTLDCKLFAAGDWWEYLNAFSDAILELDGSPALHGRILVDCQTEDLLRLLAEKRHAIPTYLYVTSMEGAVEKANSLRCAGITIGYTLASARDVRSAQEAGLKVTFFGTDGSNSHRSALRKKPDRLQTDAPRAFAN
ncbi:MAG: hypothetical protein IPL52_02580 [Flavobacteriales bacterium]|nr:hypothetical protein [Flavobacteriales bacterium]